MLAISLNEESPFAIFTSRQYKINGPQGHVNAVNAYIHGGVALSTSDEWPFNDRWDGGLGGVMATTRERAKEWLGRDATDDEIRESLQKDVDELDVFCQGEVYGFTITDENGEIIESVGGYVGDENYCREEAKSFVDSYSEEQK